MSDIPVHGLHLLSRRTEAGEIELSLVERAVRQPAADEVLIRIEASPINPSDLFGAVGGADLTQSRVGGSPAHPTLTITTPQQPPTGLNADYSPLGGEGAGVVIAAGADAQHLLGRTVATINGQMFAQYVTTKAAACLPLPDGLDARDGAASFVNPYTTLLMLEHMRLDGHSAIIHTAAASNLGQMLVKLCHAEGVPLVNVVRRPEQAATLRALGAQHVCDTSMPSFREDLVAAIIATGATIAFDAIGGGGMAADLLSAMEEAAVARGALATRYGTAVDKQVYIYGRLDFSPIILAQEAGMRWGVSGWLSSHVSQRLTPERAMELRARIAPGLKTTFASQYTREIGLADLLKPEVLTAANRRATGEKFLIRPH